MKLRTILLCLATASALAACEKTSVKSVKSPSFTTTPQRMLLVSHPRGEADTRTSGITAKLLDAVKSCGIAATSMAVPRSELKDMNEKLIDTSVEQTISYYQMDSVLDIDPSLVKSAVESPLTIHLFSDADDVKGYRYKITLSNAAGTDLWQVILDPHYPEYRDKTPAIYGNLILKKMHEDGILPQGCAGPIPE